MVTNALCISHYLLHVFHILILTNNQYHLSQFWNDFYHFRCLWNFLKMGSHSRHSCNARKICLTDLVTFFCIYTLDMIHIILVLKFCSPALLKHLQLLLWCFFQTKYTKFVQIMTLGCHLTYLRQGQICVSMQLYGENIAKSFSHNVLKTNSWNLQCLIKVANPLRYNQNFVPRGLYAFAPVACAMHV